MPRKFQNHFGLDSTGQSPLPSSKWFSALPLSSHHSCFMSIVLEGLDLRAEGNPEHKQEENGSLSDYCYLLLFVTTGHFHSSSFPRPATAGLRVHHSFPKQFPSLTRATELWGICQPLWELEVPNDCRQWWMFNTSWSSRKQWFCITHTT